MHAPPNRWPPARLEVAADNLRVDAATAEILRAFRTSQIEALLLKGPSIGQWLYSQADPRPYNDCDLLVQPDQVDDAEAVLAALGFVRQFDEDGLPDWWREHGAVWQRVQDGVAVDLHHKLPELGVDSESAWKVLVAGAETIPVGGERVPVLGLPARALHVALHALHHGSEMPRPLIDLQRALAQVPESVWRRAGILAEQLRATDAFATGLRLTPTGHELAARLALPAPRSVEAALLASTPPPVALGIESLAAAGSVRERSAILRHKLVPPPGFMRRWHPLASRGRLGLVLAYLYRPLWILRRVPQGLRAWQRARRSARG